MCQTYIELFPDGSDRGAKYWPVSQGPLLNSGWHLDVITLCAVPGGHRHSAVEPFPRLWPVPRGLNSIVSGHGNPIWWEFVLELIRLSVVYQLVFTKLLTWNILKQSLSGAQ